jgi:hypothetical protein
MSERTAGSGRASGEACPSGAGVGGVVQSQNVVQGT